MKFLLSAAAFAAASLVMTAAHAQDFRLNPTYGAVNLTTGFSDDPHVVAVQSGGSIDAATLNSRQHAGNCTGLIANAPDVRLNYTAGSTLPLIISVASSADTTLVVNGPDGQWYCDDDSGVTGMNPSLRWAHPASGQYDIWIGTYGSNALRDAQLNISEVRSQ